MTRPSLSDTNEPVAFGASAQLLAVTEDPRHRGVACGYVTQLNTVLLSLGAGVSNRPAGTARHTSRPPLSNLAEGRQWVTAPAVATPCPERLASVLQMA